MNKFLNIVFIFFSIIIGVIIFFIALNYILATIYIPDSCYYHVHKTTMIFDLFYDLPAGEGFHPFPTRFNFIISILTGGFLGYKLAKSLIRWKINTFEK